MSVSLNMKAAALLGVLTLAAPAATASTTIAISGQPSAVDATDILAEPQVGRCYLPAAATTVAA